MNEICKLVLSQLFKGVELTDDVKEELVGTVLKDENGKVIGYVMAVDMDKDIAYCDLYDGPVKDKLLENYKCSVEFVNE